MIKLLTNYDVAGLQALKAEYLSADDRKRAEMTSSAEHLFETIGKNLRTRPYTPLLYRVSKGETTAYVFGISHFDLATCNITPIFDVAKGSSKIFVERMPEPHETLGEYFLNIERQLRNTHVPIEELDTPELLEGIRKKYAERPAEDDSIPAVFGLSQMIWDIYVAHIGHQSLFEKGREITPSREELYDREAVWADRLLAELDGSNKTFTVAVGGTHLVGDGIIAQLAEKGCIIERINSRSLEPYGEADLPVDSLLK
ncbi:MAG: TraB/GumN family protein [Simkaniaceae bacterium]|nr:TraB/GumN family protein [Simkaniaceae bacterium]